MESDDQDFVFYGTPIEREEDTSSRNRKVVAAAGNLRSLPAWKQEVTDEEGRRRFHGAFTGGFSAGYYNTAGSKEGWSPQTFTSSRKNRAEVNKQNIYNFIDEDDIKDMGGQGLETSLKFDTFGFTSAEFARKKAEKEQKNRPSIIPGPVPDEIVIPASTSIGVKLLLKMGWRRDHSIMETQANSLNDARREARKALLAFSGNDSGKNQLHTGINPSDTRDSTQRDNNNVFSSQSTPLYVLNPKQDLYGLGYDPFKHAPEFHENKMLREAKNNGVKRGVLMKGGHLAQSSGKYAPGFGIGALEELDVEDEDIYASGIGLLGTEIEEDEPSRIIIGDKLKLENTKNGLPGFKIASSYDYILERFQPPVIPPDFKPFHKFASPLEIMAKFLEPPPAEVPPPEDDNSRLLIDGFANLVARCGKLFEDLSKEKNRSNPLFSFLFGGTGYGYYARKLWESKQRRAGQEKMPGVELVASDHRITADTRGKILGERPLERSSNDSPESATLTAVVHFQSNLSDTFTKSAALVESSECPKPFKEDPAKQTRFELFLKEKYQGGLRSSSHSRADKMSEAERARERLDFEAAAEIITKEKWNKKDSLQRNQQSIEFSSSGDERFVFSGGLTRGCSQDEEKLEDKILPKREEFQWRPSPLLCKRFDIVDPFMGKPPPAPRPRSKMDALVYVAGSMDAKNEGSIKANPNSSSVASKNAISEAPQEKEPAAEEQLNTDLSTGVSRPVDLYKAIFSDDSDEEDEDALNFNSAVEPEKTSEGANTTLNRLIAGDFLESLGKELGLEVPEDPSIFPRANSTRTASNHAKLVPAPETANVSNNKEIRIPESAGFSAPSKADNSRAANNGVLSGHYVKETDKLERKQDNKHRSSSRRRRSGSESDSSCDRGRRNNLRSEKKASSSKSEHRKHVGRHRKRKRSNRHSSSDESDSDSDDGRMDAKSRDRRKRSDGGRKHH